MGDQLTSQILLGISKAPQSGIGVPKTLAAEFNAALTNAANITLPVTEKILDEQLIGAGTQEFATTSSNDYVTPPAITLADRINTNQFAVLAKRHMGGAVTDNVISAGAVWDHIIEFMLVSADPTPQLSTMAALLGGMDFLLADMIANNLSFSFSDNNRPTYSVDMVGSGKFDYMSAQTPALVLPAGAAQNYTGSNAAIVVSLDDGSALDFSALGRLQSFSVQSSLNCDVQDRRPGDSFRTSGNIESGAYVGRAAHGKRTAQVSVGVYNDGNKREYLAALNNTTINDLKFKAVGSKIGATAYSHEVEITIPKSIIRVVGFGDNKEKQILPLTFEPLLKSGEAGIYKMRFRNATATLT